MVQLKFGLRSLPRPSRIRGGFGVIEITESPVFAYIFRDWPEPAIFRAAPPIGHRGGAGRTAKTVIWTGRLRAVEREDEIVDRLRRPVTASSGPVEWPVAPARNTPP